MSASSEMRQALIDGNVDLVWRMWGTWFPGQAQPENWQAAQVMMHIARAMASSVPVKFRCYSHHFLIERGIPSPLPDRLRAKAEQYCPKVLPAVGFAWGSGSKVLRPAKAEIESAVHARISEMAADGVLDRVDYVRTEIILTKNRTLHALFGNIGKLKERTA